MANYYCSTSGSDSNNGLSEAAPFQTLSKLSQSVGSGDNGFIKRGDTWTYATHGTGMLLTGADAANEAGRITFDAYGAGALPILDAQWTNVGDYVYLAALGNYNTLKNVSCRHAGPENSGTDSGAGGIRASGKLATIVENCDVDGAWRHGIAIHQGATSAASANRVSGCTVRNVARAQQSGFNWAGGIFAIRGGEGANFSMVIENNTVYESFGEGIGGGRGPWNVAVRNNEIYAARQLGIYFDATKDCEASRNIVYGSSNSTYQRFSGVPSYCFEANCEDGASTNQATNFGGFDVFLNLFAFGRAGMRMGSQKAGANVQGFVYEQNTIVDCVWSFMDGVVTWDGSDGNFIRNNISMPISVGTAHVAGNTDADVTCSHNYWYTARAAAPTNNYAGTGDRSSSTPVLGKMTGWQSINVLGGVTSEDFEPQSSVTSTDLSYGGDYYNASGITMNEHGAIKFGSSSTPPAQSWRYFEVRAVNAAGNGEWSSRLYAATEEA